MSRDVVRAVACPYCGADRGEPCRATPTRRTHYTHAARARHFEETAYLRAELRLTDGDLYVAVQEVRRLREAWGAVDGVLKNKDLTMLARLAAVSAIKNAALAALDGAE